jgi:hypothetical protein
MNRQPKGKSTGGQFAPDVNAESAVVLDDLTAVDFGDVTNVQEGSRTPWGTADSADHIAPGIVVVGTPGHGGVKLSPERNRQIHSALRNASGWYEEDCESYIPMMMHPEAFARPDRSAQDVFEQGEQGVINWFPDGYEAAFHTTLFRGASSQKDQKTWRSLHADDEIAVSARGWGNDLPEGVVAVTVCRGGRDDAGRYMDEEREILVPKEDYDNPEFRHPLGKHAGSFVVDPSKDYVDVMPPPKAPNPPARRYREVDTSGLSSDARRRAERDLVKQFRFSDGSDGNRVQSVREIIESGGIVGKSSIENNGRRTYYLRHAQEAEGLPATDTFYALEVSKALWNCVNAPAS